MSRVDVNGVGIEYQVTGQDGPGHWMQLEAPDQVNGLLLDFLAR